MIQLLEEYCPSKEAELAEYLLHNNSPNDSGYRQFLAPVTDEALSFLKRANFTEPRILDYGSGPGPTISAVLQEKGWSVVNYDPFFSPDTSQLTTPFQLITTTEVVEHFHYPASSWEHILSLLAEDGLLLVMTQIYDEQSKPEDFQKWHYIREQSHVAFYHSATLAWIAKKYELSLSVLSPRLFAFSRDKDS